MTALTILGMVLIAASLANGVRGARQRRRDERRTGRRPR